MLAFVVRPVAFSFLSFVRCFNSQECRARFAKRDRRAKTSSSAPRSSARRPGRCRDRRQVRAQHTRNARARTHLLGECVAQLSQRNGAACEPPSRQRQRQDRRRRTPRALTDERSMQLDGQRLSARAAAEAPSETKQQTVLPRFATAGRRDRDARRSRPGDAAVSARRQRRRRGDQARARGAARRGASQRCDRASAAARACRSSARSAARSALRSVTEQTVAARARRAARTAHSVFKSIGSANSVSISRNESS